MEARVLMVVQPEQQQGILLVQVQVRIQAFPEAVGKKDQERPFGGWFFTRAVSVRTVYIYTQHTVVNCQRLIGFRAHNSERVVPITFCKLPN